MTSSENAWHFPRSSLWVLLVPLDLNQIGGKQLLLVTFSRLRIETGPDKVKWLFCTHLAVISRTLDMLILVPLFTSFVCLPLNTGSLLYACFSAFLCVVFVFGFFLFFLLLLSPPPFHYLLPLSFLHIRTPIYYFPSQADITVLLGVPFSGGQNPSGCHTITFQGMYFRISPRGGVCTISVASSLLNRGRMDGFAAVKWNVQEDLDLLSTRQKEDRLAWKACEYRASRLGVSGYVNDWAGKAWFSCLWTEWNRNDRLSECAHPCICACAHVFLSFCTFYVHVCMHGDVRKCI